LLDRSGVAPVERLLQQLRAGVARRPASITPTT